jgi:hypothetical protein
MTQMTRTTRDQMHRDIEALQAGLRGEEVNGVKLLDGNREWAKGHIETLARLLNGETLVEA